MNLKKTLSVAFLTMMTFTTPEASTFKDILLTGGDAHEVVDLLKGKEEGWSNGTKLTVQADVSLLPMKMVVNDKVYSDKNVNQLYLKLMGSGVPLFKDVILDSGAKPLSYPEEMRAHISCELSSEEDLCRITGENLSIAYVDPAILKDFDLYDVNFDQDGIYSSAFRFIQTASFAGSYSRVVVNKSLKHSKASYYDSRDYLRALNLSESFQAKMLDMSSVQGPFGSGTGSPVTTTRAFARIICEDNGEVECQLQNLDLN